jgi:formylglycine-generating enzyme required for sulfatase activity
MQNNNKPGAVLLISSGGILRQIFLPILSSDLVPYLNLIDAQEFSRQINSQPPDENEAPQIIFLDISNKDLSKKIRAEIQETAVYKSIPLIDIQVSSDISDQRLIDKILKIAEQGIKFRGSVSAPVDSKEMVYIPAGVYNRRRGISPSFSEVERDSRSGSFTHAFYMDRYPVTNQEFYEFAQAKKHPAPAESWKDGSYPPDKSDHPVTGVRWDDVLAYADWADKHIPTPDQWEKATFGERGQNFPWGDDFVLDLCNVSESEIGGTTPVGFYSPEGDSPYGISDLFGNVWEWVYEWTTSAETRMLMGGAFDTPRRYLLPPYYARVHANPGLAGANFGFRLCSLLKVQHLEDF